MLLLMEPGHRDHRWDLLEQARPRLLAALREEGVSRIEFVAAFPGQHRIAVWLGTGSDAERDLLGERNPGLVVVRQVLVETGFELRDLDGLVTVAQSQETVDREYEGSWFFATR